MWNVGTWKMVKKCLKGEIKVRKSKRKRERDKCDYFVYWKSVICNI